MQYISTRGDRTPYKFCDILLEGLALDGGLFMPDHYPVVTKDTLTAWRLLSYADLAFEILSLYIDDIPASDIKAICHATYCKEIFGCADIAPLKKIKEGLYLQGLSNGPTLAFKDMAMQLLGNLFEYELTRRGKILNILGATSGDTGSAAEYAMRGKKGVRVFMTSPLGRMSEFQQAQMFSLQDTNIHNIAIDGVFDDCQDIVKLVSSDLHFKKKYCIGTVNSINWARLMAQVVYYFFAYLQATKNNDEYVNFSVPSGNFGNVCAGHVARMMGLPIAHLIVATNENDVLDEFFKTGCYCVRTSANTFETSSPSMDISKASNFERFIFDLLDRDGARTKDLFSGARAYNTDGAGGFDLSADPVFELCQNRYGFNSGKSTHLDRLETIRLTWQHHQILIDPHTADALTVAKLFHDLPGVMIVLETALPVKFSDTVEAALGFKPPIPVKFAGIEQLPRRVTVLDADVVQVKNFIAQHSGDSSKGTIVKILLAIDGSHTAAEAARHVVDLSNNGLHCTIVLANVQESATFYELLFAKDMALIEQACAQAGLDMLRDAAHILDAAGICYEREVRKGDIANTLLDITDDYGCTMIVMGARSDSESRSTAIGSVANEVMHSSRVPVTLVRLVGTDDDETM
jgi:threonine synthase